MLPKLELENCGLLSELTVHKRVKYNKQIADLNATINTDFKHIWEPTDSL